MRWSLLPLGLLLQVVVWPFAVAGVRLVVGGCSSVSARGEMHTIHTDDKIRHETTAFTMSNVSKLIADNSCLSNHLVRGSVLYSVCHGELCFEREKLLSSIPNGQSTIMQQVDSLENEGPS